MHDYFRGNPERQAARSSSCASASRSRPSTATATRASPRSTSTASRRSGCSRRSASSTRSCSSTTPRRSRTRSRAFNRWLDDDWGFDYQDRIFAAPYISLADLDWAVRELEWALDHGARIVVHAPGRAAHRRRASVPPSDPRFDPFWARVQRGRHHRRRARRRQRLLAATATRSTASRPAFGGGGWAPSIKAFHIERAAYDFLITLVFDKLFERFPNVRVASVENGSEFLARPVQEAALDRRTRCPATSPTTRSSRSSATSGSTRSGRTTCYEVVELHGRRPRDLRLRLAAHRGHAPAARLRGRAQGASTTTTQQRILRDNARELNTLRPA